MPATKTSEIAERKNLKALYKKAIAKQDIAASLKELYSTGYLFIRQPLKIK